MGAATRAFMTSNRADLTSRASNCSCIGTSLVDPRGQQFAMMGPPMSSGSVSPVA